jgi:hypothetical protein
MSTSAIELCQMKTCQGNWFKLKCSYGVKIQGSLAQMISYSPSGMYSFSLMPHLLRLKAGHFQWCREGLLDEDFGTDEIYARLNLTNLVSLSAITKKTIR